jgi:hypothetical protein
MTAHKAKTVGDLLSSLTEEERRLRGIRTATCARQIKVTTAIELAALHDEIVTKVRLCRESGNGNEATQWRAVQTYVDSLLAELRMWLAIEEHDADAAWNHFCSAEQHAEDAVRYLADFAPATRQFEHIKEVERVVFPQQVAFFSSGLLIVPGGQHCTICGSVYGECNHLAGEIYDGEIAARAVTEIAEILEVSMVQDPADKRCRITSVSGIDPLTGLPSRAPKKLDKSGETKDRRPNKKRGQQHR